MQTEIPEDVMKAAREAIAQDGWGIDGDLAYCYFVIAVIDILPIARAIMAERERDKWQPIETAPKDGTHIILPRFGDEYFEVAGGEWRLNPKAGEDGLNGFEAWISNPTHWMPIPTPPKQEA